MNDQPSKLKPVARRSIEDEIERLGSQDWFYVAIILAAGAGIWFFY